MHEIQSPLPASKDPSLETRIYSCLEAERNRGLSLRSVNELRRYLSRFTEQCRKSGIDSVSQLTLVFLKDFVEHCWHRGGPPVVKATVWSVRKFCEYLTLIQVLPANPAKDLHHPKTSVRERLPQYLSCSQLRELLETATHKRPLREFTILCLFVTTGLRPHEVVSLTLEQIHLHQLRIDLKVKGGWVKKTP